MYILSLVVDGGHLVRIMFFSLQIMKYWTSPMGALIIKLYSSFGSCSSENWLLYISFTPSSVIDCRNPALLIKSNKNYFPNLDMTKMGKFVISLTIIQ